MTDPGHVVLVGLPGSGKSAVAPLLARRLGRECVDTDAEVEQRLGMSVARVFADLGEGRFRAEERRAAELALASSRPLVIAAGGGLIAQRGAVEVLERHGIVVCLDAPDAHLADRVAQDAERPLLDAAPAKHLPHLRAARAAAHGHALLHVATGGRSAPEVAEIIAVALAGAIRVATRHPYLVRVGTGVLDGVAEHAPPAARRIAVIADEAVAAVAGRVTARLRVDGRDVVEMSLAGGEQAKQWSVAGGLLERCSEAGLGRNDCIVAVGGGSLGDVAGLVAATYMRGVAWMVVPTTLLAMVDSAVGGKTGVNLRRGKNLAGAFWQPRAVLCDPEVLATLPERSFRSAFAEIVKTSMVGGAEPGEVVEQRLQPALQRDGDALTDIIRACCAFKAAIVAADEREDGARAILNYGHTVGHAVEAIDGSAGGLDHGEAVAFGMRVAGALSVVESGCPGADIARQDALLDACGLTRRPSLAAAEIAARLRADKKARAGVSRWVLLRSRGDPVTGIVIEPDAVRSALAEALAA